MDPTFFPELVLVVVVAWIIFTLRTPPSLWQRLDGEFDRLRNELAHGLDRGGRLPIFSAETVRGKEAEFIRERLPRKAPHILLTLALLVIVVLGWWLKR